MDIITIKTAITALILQRRQREEDLQIALDTLQHIDLTESYESLIQGIKDDIAIIERSLAELSALQLKIICPLEDVSHA